VTEQVQGVELTGRTLRPEQVVQLAAHAARAEIAPEARARAAAAAEAAERIAARQPVYGRTTGVGANRTQQVEQGDAEHGLRLLRSHAGGIGRIVPPVTTRAMLAVRANQLLAGGAGLHPKIIDAVVAALNADTLPRIHEYGGLGTADLTALAELGLTIAGERPWSPAPIPSTSHPAAPPAPVHITSGDALALMSSSALTIGNACLAWHEAARWVDAAHAVAALTFVALSGSVEPYAEAVHERRPYPGSIRSAATLRVLLDGQDNKAYRIQDPYALRCIPQIHGAAFAALATTERSLAVEVNAAAENPLVSVADDTFFHHGGFHQAQLTQALDALNLALLAVGQLSLARLNLLFQPEFTGLRPFLADGAPASSGVMILENSAQDAQSDLRNAAMPVALGHAVLSRGVEDHSPFTSQAARQTNRAHVALRLVLATELVGAVRGLRLRGIEPAKGTVLGDVYTCVDVLDKDTADRSPAADVELAADLLPDLAAQVADLAAHP
jgi:histidine ammonia-lyase